MLFETFLGWEDPVAALALSKGAVTYVEIKLSPLLVLYSAISTRKHFFCLWLWFPNFVRELFVRNLVKT